MGNNYVLSLQPTFTQGLILGQLSILVLLGLVLKYLFLDSSEILSSSYHPRVDNVSPLRNPKVTLHELANGGSESWATESTEWFNMLLHQVVEVYRCKLRDNLSGLEGDEIARRRIEDYANDIRPAGFLGHIKVHSVDLGVSAPCLSNARIKTGGNFKPQSEIDFDATYTDSISISLSTSYLFHYPKSSFARLPVSLTISLSLFKSSIKVIPPSPTSTPVLTVSIAPEFTLDLTTTSLMGSRAKLADVPKLHELIQHQVRRILAAQGIWKIALPGLDGVPDMQEAASTRHL